MKKILVLAFVSVAILLGCSADYALPDTPTPPEWKGGPSIPGGGGGSNPPPSGGSGRGCEIYGFCIVNIDSDFTAQDCRDANGTVVSDPCY